MAARSSATIKCDTLQFPFEGTYRKLHSLIEKRVEEALASILEQYCNWGQDVLHRDLGFRHLVRAKRRKVEFRFLTMGVEGIRSLLREAAHRVADTDRRSFSALGISIHQTDFVKDGGCTETLPVSYGSLPLRWSHELPDGGKRGDVPGWAPPEAPAVLLPVHAMEPLAIHFEGSYPMAVTVTMGGVNIFTGAASHAGAGADKGTGTGLRRDPQNYFVSNEQRWLDGFLYRQGYVRQFIVVPYGEGLSTGEQIFSDAPATTGFQISVTPLKADAYFVSHILRFIPSRLEEVIHELVRREHGEQRDLILPREGARPPALLPPLGMGFGDEQRQPIYEDSHDLADWDDAKTIEVRFLPCAAQQWRTLTGDKLPPPPPLNRIAAGSASIHRRSSARKDRREMGLPAAEDGK